MAAYKLGAEVFSFDYDKQSVEATTLLRDKFAEDSGRWQVGQGSVLDREYLNALGKFDIVYAWGVLHHTGNMERALNNTAAMVEDNGLLYISLYNDEELASKFWRHIKQMYNKSVFLRWSL